MPIYEYRCENGHQFEVIQSMADEPVEACEQCGAPVERVFHPVAVHFKGSGFYTTDYAGKGKPEDGKGAESGDGKGGESGSSESSGESKKSDSGGGGSKGSGSTDSGSGKPAASSGSGGSKRGGEKKARTGPGSD
jgi:putative FmdB family regulatory protein